MLLISWFRIDNRNSQQEQDRSISNNENHLTSAVWERFFPKLFFVNTEIYPPGWQIFLPKPVNLRMFVALVLIC